jgi:hypothetical protein
MNDFLEKSHLATIVLGRMDGDRPVYPGSEDLSFERRVQNALLYFSHQDHGLFQSEFPDWLKASVKKRVVIGLIVKSWLKAPENDILR